MKKLKAFTLAEILIVLCVIGVLASIMLTSLTGMSPDKTKILFKKAYQITERTVGELVNDETFYPYDPSRIGFRNTTIASWPGDTSQTFGGNTKFCKLFAKKLNTMGDLDTKTGSACAFTTSDNIRWYVPFSTFAGNTPATIMVDINGYNNGPNKRTGTADGDQFYINVYYDGTVEPYHSGSSETIEQTFLKSHTVQKDKK